MKKIYFYNKKFAFTLAETLIVMGIIGVVAALTLPNLNSSTANKEKVVKLQKIYSNLQDAFGRAEAVYGPYNEWFINDTTLDAKNKRAFERITEFMKYSKVCTVSDACSLFGSNDAGSGGIRTPYAVVLADGTTIGFMSRNANPNTLRIYIDLDGPSKGSNLGGKDTFFLAVNEFHGTTGKGISYNPYYSRNSANEIDKFISKNSADKSKTTTWILEYGNMDYLNCSGLKFVTNTTCK